MSQQIEGITKWKIQLESKERREHLNALIEIVTIINCEEDERNREKFCRALIEAEICHFLVELLIYNWQSTIRLINKIICHLSEQQLFFKHDFFKVLRYFLRLINSFPPKEQDIRVEYRNNIVSTALLVIKR
jgi:hypothetical protein